MSAQPFSLHAVRQTADDLLDHFIFEATGGEVIEKEERLRALHGDVIDAVVYQVLTDSVMNAELEGDLELGADAIGARDEHGIFIALEIGREERAEAADAAEHATGEGLLRERLDTLLGLIAARDIDAGIGIGDLLVFCCGQRNSFYGAQGGLRRPSLSASNFRPSPWLEADWHLPGPSSKR